MEGYLVQLLKKADGWNEEQMKRAETLPLLFYENLLRLAAGVCLKNLGLIDLLFK